jgi:hypothetical protein
MDITLNHIENNDIDIAKNNLKIIHSHIINDGFTKAHFMNGYHWNMYQLRLFLD